MKKISLFILFFILACFVLEAYACGGKQDREGSQNSSEAVVNYTDIDLVSSGRTDYAVVIPAAAEYEERFAANEFKNIFKLSTGINIDILSENENMDTTGYYFAIGNTELKRKAGITNRITDREHAFRVARKNNTVIMTGIDLGGTVFATYEYLKAQLGYKYYAADEIYVDEVTDEKLIDIDFEYAPYTTRNATSTSVKTSKESAYRLYSSRPEWPLGWPHSYTSIVQKSVYSEQHPEWFTTGSDGTAICLTNEELQRTYAVNLINKLISTGYRSAMMGQDDGFVRCVCDNCKRSNEAYTEAGTNILFVNSVARYMDEEIARRKQEDPSFDLDYELMLLAYYQNETPPVEQDASGTWIPVKVENGNKTYAPELMLHDRVGVQICLVYSDAGAPFLSEKNAVTVKDSYGWQTLTGGDKIEYWIYRGYFVMYDMMFYNDYAYITDWIKGLKQFNSRQSQWDSLDFALFAKMRAYILSQLCYNVDQNINELIEDFILHYYKEAAPFVQEFFDTATAHLNAKKAWYEANNQDFGFYVMGSQQKNLYSADTWPQQLLLRWNDLFERAHAAINASNRTPFEKEILNARVSNEGIFSRYWNLKFYGDTYPEGERIRMQEEVLNEAYLIGYESAYVKFN